MQKEEIYKEILNKNAVLITGSGANVGVKNHEGEDFLVGTKLAELLYKECGIDVPDDPHDLQDASQTFLERKSASELIRFLKKIYNVGQLNESTRVMYDFPWVRCYTTNYDEVPILAPDKKMVPITVNMSTKGYIDNNDCCIYINGYIGNLDEESLNKEFKLTTKSYLSTDNIMKSQWGSVFRDDLDYAKVIVIIGLSLNYDLDLGRILSDNQLMQKVIFIEKPGISEDKKRKLKRFGEVWDIGLEQFINDVSNFRNTKFVPEEKERRLVCFEKNSFNRSKQKANSSEVYELLMRGELNNSIFWKEQGRYSALIYRERVSDIINAINKDIRVVFLHANLGNGKSVFLEILKHQLFNRNISTYTFLEENNNREKGDIENIISVLGKKVIIIENYFNHIEVLKKFSYHDCTNITFILTARTMVYEVKVNEVCELFDIDEGQSVVFDINKLTDKEINNCLALLDEYEFWGTKAALPKNKKKVLLTNKNHGNYELQSILLEIINSSTIKDRIDNIVEEIKKESGEYYQCLLILLLAKVMALELKVADVSGITQTSGLNDIRFIRSTAVQELVVLKDDEKMDFKIKSSVVARVILNNINNSADIIDALKRIAIYADGYSEHERFKSILHNIVSFSHVNTFLNGKRDNIDFIMDYFDTLKNMQYYKENSFFWLQYSIACIKYEKFELAQNYVDVAYAKFRKNDENLPFQCDNQQARIYLEQIKQGKSNDVVSDFKKAHQLVMKKIISKKDREEMTIRLLNIYVDKLFLNQIEKAGLGELYKQYCGQGYNKTVNFLNNLKNERDRERYAALREKLLKASLS